MDLKKFFEITNKLERETGKSVYNQSVEPNWMDIMVIGRYCRILHFNDDSIWCYEQAYPLTDSLDLPTEKKEELKSSVLSAKVLPYVEKGDYNYALTLCKEAIKLWSENAEAYCNQGVVFNYLGEFDKSYNSHSRAIELNPDLSQSWNAIGHVLVDYYKDHLKAIKYLDKALELTEGKDTRAWINKGNALMWLGKYDAAILCWETAYEIEPSCNVHAILNKAMVQDAVLNDKKNAIRSLYSVLNDINEDHPQYQDVLSLLTDLKNEG
mgnify:CR=1 FL=1